MSDATIIDTLLAGDAFVDLSPWRKLAVSGSDARGWLNDLVSADIADLRPGRARRSLLLSPTGRIRAEFTVAAPGGDLLLIQDPAQPASIGDLLAPYVLSSDVELRDRTSDLALFAFPGRPAPPDAPGTVASVPSCVGAGAELFAPVAAHDSLLTLLSEAYALAGPADLDGWRAIAGIPRFGVDASEDDLPEEGGLAHAVSFDKGCYLGQEAVAKVRNLGHPRRTVEHLTAAEGIVAGESVESNGRPAGEITSAASNDGRWWGLARVSWEARGEPLQTARGIPLSPAAR